MTDLENVFEKGKYFLSQGDIPSAVLCFESAVKQEPSNAEIWELLGTCQAGNVLGFSKQNKQTKSKVKNSSQKMKMIQSR